MNFKNWYRKEFSINNVAKAYKINLRRGKVNKSTLQIEFAIPIESNFHSLAKKLTQFKKDFHNSGLNQISILNREQQFFVRCFWNCIFLGWDYAVANPNLHSVTPRTRAFACNVNRTWNKICGKSFPFVSAPLRS